ncbi:XdhC family protein [Mesobacterium pallidum]|uniref:XdhC family protein n=1 Tax=Mesobacterium pallidum TaxID=2872037 RepID=UPI001EE347DC|nr:XdhC family protein [Mesobacterium pallidum]
MTPGMTADVDSVARALRDRGEAFAFATILRTVGATAAKPGAKAVLGADGAILHGWLGGGCTRGAVKAAVLRALEEGRPQLVSVAPEELLADMGVAPGQEVDGRRYARNGCPSKGSIEIFVEPCLPVPELVVLGASPVAQALAGLAPQFHWQVSGAVPEAASAHGQRIIVIATQGQGDMDALTAALAEPFDHVAFVGSRKKFAALATRLKEAGVDPARIDAVRAPAGLDIGAVTPEEIALSILAELVQVRRGRGPSCAG